MTGEDAAGEPGIEWIPAKTIVIKSKSVSFDRYLAAEYTINIYRGCSHGCIYCFARGEYYRIEEFDRVRAKRDALRIIRDELRRKVKPGVVTTGGMSDPYNPWEEKLLLTRHSLELMNAYGFGINILTKSGLVTRDMDVLSDIREHSPVNVSFTITCAEDGLCSRVEPHVAPSSERLRTLEQLATNKIVTGVLLDPVIPYLTDTEENVRELVKKAKHHGASYIYASMGVTMEGLQRDHFFREAEKIAPGTAERYRKRYGNRYYCPSPRAGKLWEAFVRECEDQKIIYDMKAVNGLIRSGYDLSAMQLRF